MTDGATRYTVLVRESALPEMGLPDKPAHLLFIEWWREYCIRVHLPPPSRGPESLQVVKRLLEHNNLDELKRLAVHCILDYGERLKDNPHHFPIFASLLPTLKGELNARD